MGIHGCNGGDGRRRMPPWLAAFQAMGWPPGAGAGPSPWDIGWDFPPRGGSRGFRRGGGPRGRMFAGGELRLVLLALIAEQSRHGYELIKAIDEITGGEYAPSPGVVYPTLSLLLDEGAVDEVADQSPRKAFAVTDAGRAELAERKDEADALLARLKSLGQAKEGERPPAIGRAVANLLGALKGRFAGGEFDRDTVNAVADILDEAARRIERL